MLVPEFIAEIDKEAVVGDGGTPVLGIQSDNRILFLDEAGTPVQYQEGGRVAVDNRWWAASRGSEVEIREPNGRLRSRIPISAVPYTRNGQLFLLHDAEGTLFKVDPANGAVLWRREFISKVTVLDAHGDRNLVGLLDGRCLLIDDSGEALLEYRPGGSRIEAIYGGALSPDGTKVAIIAGLDPQRFILLAERKNGFRPVTSHSTETDFRRYVFVDFVNSGTLVVYESEGYVSAVEVDGYEYRQLEVPGTPVAWSTVSDTGALAMLGVGSTNGVLKILSRYELSLFEANLPADMNAMKVEGDKIYLIGQDRYGVLRMSF